MFDLFRSSYDIGEQFTEVELHTKDIEDGIGGTMSQYWLSPDGVLYYIDYSKTADFVEIEEGDERYNDELPFLNFIWQPNGNHGKVTPLFLTKYVEVYPSIWNGDWKSWPRCKLHFKNGKLMDFENVTEKNE